MLRETFNLALDAIKKSNVHCLMIGGLAMNQYGFVRATSDVDFMMVGDDLPVMRTCMMETGFQNIVVRDNVVFFRRPGINVRVDFLQIDRDTMNKLWVRSQEARVGDHIVHIPAPFDMIAMKLFALKQDWPRRMVKDVPDILFLIKTRNMNLDRDIKPLAQEFADDAIYGRIYEAWRADTENR